MGIERFRPSDINASVKSGNREHLSVAGKKGAEVTNRKKSEKAANNEALELEERRRREDEENALRKSTNEDILTPEGIEPGEEEW